MRVAREAACFPPQKNRKARHVESGLRIDLFRGGKCEQLFAANRSSGEANMD